MMKLVPLYIVLLIGSTLVSCGSDTTEKSGVTTPEEKVATYTPETLEAEIIKLEGMAMNPDHPKSREITLSVIDFCDSYANLYSSDAKAPEMLFKAGNHSVNLENYSSAVGFYQRVETKYRAYQKRPECIFLQGFVYETYLNELGKAQEKYEKIIKQYPNHVLAEQSRQSIRYLGMTDEERIQQFESN